MFLMLLTHCVRRAASRAELTAGKQQQDQDRNNGDDHQQLDQRKCAACDTAAMDGLMAGGEDSIQHVFRYLLLEVYLVFGSVRHGRIIIRALALTFVHAGRAIVDQVVASIRGRKRVDFWKIPHRLHASFRLPSVIAG